MPYRIQQIDSATLESTRKAWELAVGVEEFASEFGAIFEWIDGHYDYAEPRGNSLAYAIVEDGQQIAAAFVDIVSTNTNGGLTKLLKVFITPHFWDAEQHEVEIVQIFVAAINGVVAISNGNKSRILKIYGRTNSLFNLLENIHGSIMADADLQHLFTSSIKGRWLEIAVK